MNTNVSSETTTARPYILFSVAGTTYALPSDHVVHMDMVGQITPVPNAAPFVDGVVFSRGQVVPVINLRARFGFERAAGDIRSRLLVVDAGRRQVGLLADAAREFISIADNAIQPPSEGLDGLSGRYLAGMATLGERIVLVLDLAHLVEAPAATAN
jgi:chemotaxis signal transduction protein